MRRTRGVRVRLRGRRNQQLKLARRWRSRPASAPRAPPGGRQAGKAAPRAGARRQRAARSDYCLTGTGRSLPAVRTPQRAAVPKLARPRRAVRIWGSECPECVGLGPPRSPPPRGSVGQRVCHCRPPGTGGASPSSFSPFPLCAPALPLLAPARPAGRPPPAAPCPSRLNWGLPDSPARSEEQVSRLGSGAPRAALAPCEPPSGLGTGEGVWGAWPGGPSLPGAQGAVAGTPQRFPSQSRAWDLARVRRPGGSGRPGHPEPRPAFGAATQQSPGSPLQLPPGQASRGRREGAVRGGAVQTCWERSLGSDL